MTPSKQDIQESYEIFLKIQGLVAYNSRPAGLSQKEGVWASLAERGALLLNKNTNG